MRATLAMLITFAVTLLVALSSMSASACIPGMPEQEFEPQAMGSGPAVLQLTPITATTNEEMFPQAVTFKDRLYVAFQQEEFTTTVKYHLICQHYDGEVWSDQMFLSSPDITQPVRSELNLNPRLGATEDAVYMVWASNEPNWTEGADDDIVFRYSEDGDDWSEVIEVSSHYNDALDKMAVVEGFKGRAYFAWETKDPTDSGGSDLDIVMRAWDGSDFGQTFEVTDYHDSDNDQYVDVDADDQYMFLTWKRENTTSGKPMSDVWARVFDGTDWVTGPFKVSSDVVAVNEHPTVVAVDGSAFIIWETSDTGTTDPSAIVMRRWTPEGGLGPRMLVSSYTNGEDTKPSGLVYNDKLYVVWVSMDQGITFGSDPDVVYRTATIDDGGQVDLGDIVEVSESTDDFQDQYPTLAAVDDVLYGVWVIDQNYTSVLPPEVLEPLGGIYRSPDIAIKALELPFEKQLSLMYALGTAVPIATYPTSAEVTVTDLEGEPIEDMRVGLSYLRIGSDPSSARLKLLKDQGEGVYTAEELEFLDHGSYEVSILVNDIDVGSFIVEVDAPPPSFLGRVPATGMVFVLAAVVVGVLFYRWMGRDELVRELRPAPLDATPREVA